MKAVAGSGRNEPELHSLDKFLSIRSVHHSINGLVDQTISRNSHDAIVIIDSYLILDYIVCVVSSFGLPECNINVCLLEYLLCYFPLAWCKAHTSKRINQCENLLLWNNLLEVSWISAISAVDDDLLPLLCLRRNIKEDLDVMQPSSSWIHNRFTTQTSLYLFFWEMSIHLRVKVNPQVFVIECLSTDDVSEAVSLNVPYLVFLSENLELNRLVIHYRNLH